MVVVTQTQICIPITYNRSVLRGSLQIRYVMPSARLILREEDVVRLTLEFLHNRDLHIAQLSLERETGVINGNYSDDILFLRQLILDGQWDDVLEFIQPLEALPTFHMNKFTFNILKHKYVELLCIKSETGATAVVNQVNGECGSGNLDNAVDEVVKVLGQLERVAPSKEEYSSLCLLLTLPRLTDHLSYRDWNPSSARVQCFRQVYPLVSEFLSSDRKNSSESIGSVRASKNDRLIQLIIKGILYESCVNYCQAKATCPTTTTASSTSSKTSSTSSASLDEMTFSRVLDGSVGFSDSDLSLLSWLQSVPTETFSVPFEQRTLNVDVERLERPSLETSWTEHMLITPIKPKTFPHSAMPFTRPRSAADAMSRSLMIPATGSITDYGFGGMGPGGSVSMTGSQQPASHPNAVMSLNQKMMAMSMGDMSSSAIQRMAAHSFHLTGMKPQKVTNAQSVDRLFDAGATNGEINQVHGTTEQLPSIEEHQLSCPPSTSRVPQTSHSEPDAISQYSSQQRQSEPQNVTTRKPANVSTPEHHSVKIVGGRDSPNSVTSMSRSSRRDSLNERPVPATPTTNVPPTQNNSNAISASANAMDRSYSGDLMREYQKQKQKFQETMAIKEREREELLKQMHHMDNATPIYSGRNSIVDVTNSSVAESVSGSRQATVNGVTNSNTTQDGGPLHQVNGNILTGTVIRSATNTPSENKQVGGTYDGAQSALGHRTSSSDVEHLSDGDSAGGIVQTNRPKFVAVTSLEDVQAVRCAEFHPNGQLYAVGSNSKTLRICAYPKVTDLRENHQTYQPMVLFKRTKHHKGSIYCLAWSPMGDLMATGSNDKTVKLMHFNSETSNLDGDEIELAMHDGTIRDLCFLEDSSNKSSLLISGGAGDCKIYVTDCATGTPFQALSGHTGHILALYTWGGAMFVSGAHDKTVRFWDLRTKGCVNLVTPCTVPGTRQGSPVSSLCVDPSGRLLVSGHEDSACVLYDIRGGRSVQCFRPHSADVRSIRFSPSAYYLLSAGYDNKLVLTDLQGDLTLPLPSVVVAQHQDKVISGRWHPVEFSFLSTSADKTATLWALPPI